MADENQDENDEKDEKKPKQSNLLKIIVIVSALLITAGSGAFAYFKFFAADQQKDEKPEEVEVMDPKELIFPLDPFVVNLGGPSNFLKLTIQLEMTLPEDKQYLESRLAPIRDSIVILLSSKTAESVSSPAGKLQLKDDINVRINQALGKDLIRNVYFTEFVMQ